MSLWSAKMPSNIALIKYMGKADPKLNLPTNPSFSYTLNHLLTLVTIEPNDSNTDQWQKLDEDAEFKSPKLNEQGQQRFLNHFQLLKSHWGVNGSYTLKSGNNFPSDCGLASSASSFASLTMATYNLAKEKFGADQSLLSLANLSRQGSGSSCRSFFSPWCEWQGERVEQVDLAIERLNHKVVIVDESKKLVSSSEAHKRVTTSGLFDGRIERATQRCKELKQALASKDFNLAFEICWAECWDMHALFETSRPSFGYMTGQSVEVLNRVRRYWQEHGQGPLVTMDAGANVHLLNVCDKFMTSNCLNGFKVI